VGRLFVDKKLNRMLKLGISWKRRGDIERWALFDVNCIVREIQIRHDDRRHGKPQALVVDPGETRDCANF
jgi:hypothetical protein